MFVLLEKDCTCELNISTDLVNLFKFSKPYEKEEKEIIKYVKFLLNRENLFSKEKFIKTFNKHRKYEIFYMNA